MTALGQGTSNRIIPSRLFSTNICPCGPTAEAQVGARRRRLALRRVLLLNQLEQRLRRALVVEQDPPNRILSAVRAGCRRRRRRSRRSGCRRRSACSCSCWIAVVAVDVDAGDRRPAAAADRCDRTRRSDRSPPRRCAGSSGPDFARRRSVKLPSHMFQPRLAPAVTRLIFSTMFWPMSATNMLPFLAIPGEALRVADAVGVDLAERAGPS